MLRESDQEQCMAGEAGVGGEHGLTVSPTLLGILKDTEIPGELYRVRGSPNCGWDPIQEVPLSQGRAKEAPAGNERQRIAEFDKWNQRFKVSDLKLLATFIMTEMRVKTVPAWQ